MDVAQLVEREIVVLDVAGSSPVFHPNPFPGTAFAFPGFSVSGTGASIPDRRVSPGCSPLRIPAAAFWFAAEAASGKNLPVAMSRALFPLFLFSLPLLSLAVPLPPPWLLPLPAVPGLAAAERTARWTEEEFSQQIVLPRALSAAELSAYSAALASDGWEIRLSSAISGPDAALASSLRLLRAQGGGAFADGLSSLLSGGVAHWTRGPLSLFYLAEKRLLLCTFPFSPDVPAPAAPPGGWLFSTPLPLADAHLRQRILSLSGGVLTAAEIWTARADGKAFADGARAQLASCGWEWLPPAPAAPAAADPASLAADAALVGRIFEGTAHFRSASGARAMLSVRGGGDGGQGTYLFLLRAPAP